MTNDRAEREEALRGVRSALFAGLYDDYSLIPSEATRHVRLLNPKYNGGDASALRFAQIEID